MGKTEVSGYNPSEPQFVAVVVMPPPPSLPTVDGEGGEGGEQCFLDTTANMVESIFHVMDGNRFFVVVVVMDGRCKGGAMAMVGGLTFMIVLQISRQGMWDIDTEKRCIGTGIGCTSTAVPAGGGRRRRRRSGGRGNAMISRNNKMTRGQRNER